MKPLRILLPFSWLYGAGVGLRNMFFDVGGLRSERISVPVISIGNIAAGGRNKTPFVLEVVSILQGFGKQPAVVSRGYGRKSTGFQVVSNGKQLCAEILSAGDEPALLANLFKDVPIVVDEDRVRGARSVVEMFQSDVVVLDDGFQHRALSRDLDIVLVNADDLGGNALMPAGYLREPPGSLKRAGLVGIVQCKTLAEFEEKAASVRKYCDRPVIGFHNVVSRVQSLTDREEVELKGMKLLAFSGIADSSSFDRTLREKAALVETHLRFEDHHWYSREELKEIRRSFEAGKAEAIVTTEKDAVRLGSGIEELAGIPILKVGISVEIIAGRQTLIDLVAQAIRINKG